MVGIYHLYGSGTNFRLIMTMLFALLISFKVSVGQEFSRIETSAGFTFLERTKGIAVADYDGDHDLDVFMVIQQPYDSLNLNTASKLFRNNNDATFTDVTQEANLDKGIAAFYNKKGAAWGDFNNDGWPDLLLTYQAGFQLFQNLGNGKFEDVTTQSNLSATDGCQLYSAMWWDYDNDGYTDIFASGTIACANNRIYKNLGNGTFENVTSQMGLNTGSLSYMAIPVDVNHDGYPDVYSAVDFGENQLFLNHSGSLFTEDAAEYNLNSPGSNMALTTGDYNNDGIIDIYCTDINANSLFKGNNNHTFTDLAAFNGVKNTDWAWEARFADFDNDGDEDLYVVNGYEGVAYQNVLFRNLLLEKGGGFTDISKSSNVGIFFLSECFESFDYDNDGDLDLLVSSELDGKTPVFYNNKTIDQLAPPEKRWVEISLEGSKSNRNGFGTELEIRCDGKRQIRLYHGVGLYSQSIQPVHFGVGKAVQIDTLLVKWPSGETDTLRALPTNTQIKVVEKRGYEVLHLTNNKIYGCTDVHSCSFDPAATIDDGNSCSYLPSGKLNGPAETSMFATNEYTYEVTGENELEWNVENGEIVEGFGTTAIKVQWGIAGEGKVSVYEKGTCYGQEASLPVTIRLDQTFGEHSIARIWNEALLAAIRGDYARPTVHARNLFHAAIAMFDAWAVYDPDSRPYLLGNKIGNFMSTFNGFQANEEKIQARNKTISYAVYRLLKHRFENAPDMKESVSRFDEIMNQLGYDAAFTSTDYSKGDAAALGNYIAQTIIDYGLQDGSRESTGYDNAFYKPVNPPLEPDKPGNPNLVDPSRWQPLSLKTFIDQSGHIIVGSSPKFLSPEWGRVTPFSLSPEEASPHGNYTVYEDPGSPPYLGDANQGADYKWCFSLVSIWGSHLTPEDGQVWDISPGSIGNIDIQQLPEKYADYPGFYKLFDGGDIGKGRLLNPFTGQPYEKQLVPRGDYTRVLAEFWADGPNSETPPGHWFTILNYVSDHPLFERKLEGQGETLDRLEWDVKAYFTLGGAMHDAAIAAWSIKGYYDFIRPISAIRYMAGLGQSTDQSQPNYHPDGIPLVKGYVEVVGPEDSLAGHTLENVGKIKLYTWRGHSYIQDPKSDRAGVGWILAENWWPYQRPSFVTPPFAGYISGHSTYSRAAARVLTQLTGSEYFPGGMGEFLAPKNKFLVFEQGPSVDVRLQWATYFDASDQCSLSRIWGGIHPPSDDLPGRIIGEKIGKKAVEFAKRYFVGEPNSVAVKMVRSESKIYPNPLSSNQELKVTHTRNDQTFRLFDMQGNTLPLKRVRFTEQNKTSTLSLGSLTPGIYFLRSEGSTWKIVLQ